MPDPRVALQTQAHAPAATQRASGASASDWLRSEVDAPDEEADEARGIAGACERIAWFLPWVLAACGILTTVALAR